MFVQQWQHTWRPRDTPLVLITATNSGEAPLLPFRIWNSYFTHTFEKTGSMQQRSKCYKPNTNDSASNASRILYFIVRKDWHGVLELVGAKREMAYWLSWSTFWMNTFTPTSEMATYYIEQSHNTYTKILTYSQAFNLPPTFFVAAQPQQMP